jgi:hypothetical protein
MTAEVFKTDEWLETLLRIRETQPRRYAREVSAGLKVTVERYAERKAQAARRKAA